MPVPVPRLIKPIAHPVVKPLRATDQTPQFDSGIPSGPPPAFRTREEWINSLPSWRRTKPRRIWEDDARPSDLGATKDFLQGLVVADDAMAIKGARADACLPPLANFPVSHPQQGVPGEKCNEYGIMGHPGPAMDLFWEEDGTALCDDEVMDVEEEFDAAETSPNLVFTDLATYENQTFPRSSYSTRYEDQSPGSDSGPDSGSSPLGPVTPFADFIDRAVAAEQPYVSQDTGAVSIESSVEYGVLKQAKDVPVFPTLAEPPKEPAPVPDVVTPSATNGYKQLAEPISEWLAGYVWKVCTTGMSLPALFRYPSSRVVQYSPTPPSYLAPSIHSLLLSTLLQPSAIFLSLWYIVRLPVYFNAADLGPEYGKEMRFRQCLLGDVYSYERDALELNAPFRLFVLGCMLANKWLDDHTFSNKTWHTISNVPIQILNRLEVLALDVLAYDLSISNRDWNQWMVHVKSYHMTLASPHLQPISRPSSNPHSIIRKSIDEILQAPSPTSGDSPIPQPVFLGLEERKKEEQAASIEVLNIDLDEDGPLREEYLPRRRIGGSCIRVSRSNDSENLHANTAAPKALPPPAKWSPAGDEPILRDRNRSSGQYVAVQPSHPYPYPVPYRAPDVLYNQSWDVAFSAAPYKAYPSYAYGQPPATINAAQYSHYQPPSMATMTHSRSQSMFFDSEHHTSRSHLRSYSQARFDYKFNDARMCCHDSLSAYESEPRWTDPNPYVFSRSYAPALAVAPSAAW
ncbi:hypothetical protein EST38_g4683 [Candolleomyces aberdarensis]|uniref:Cyclin N-terminal domain-containing protein n=1 Tax=Candolleomyces aberdarensis TaxID=2316362 RepID=A0A4Q2DMH8_9AGAR|nr:hypothetical protein EST38_g4683 [Candolleomyces aberdarensis]